LSGRGVEGRSLRGRLSRGAGRRSQDVEPLEASACRQGPLRSCGDDDDSSRDDGMR
jgi:hypothetical protein